jgi:hypothetical protein
MLAEYLKKNIVPLKFALMFLVLNFFIERFKGMPISLFDISTIPVQFLFLFFFYKFLAKRL